LLCTGAIGGLGLVWSDVVHEAVVRHELSEVKLGVGPAEQGGRAFGDLLR